MDFNIIIAQPIHFLNPMTDPSLHKQKKESKRLKWGYYNSPLTQAGEVTLWLLSTKKGKEE